MLFSLGCLPLIKCPTRITPHSATLLDHIYTNNFLNPITSHILSGDISDHFPKLILLHDNKHRTLQNETYIRDTSRFKVDNFLVDLNEQFSEFSCEIEELTIDNGFGTFFNIFNIEQTCIFEEKI